MHDTKLVRTVFIALFTAIISAGCVMAIPLPGGVPIAMQNMFCVLAGSILGGVYGAISVLLWLVLGSAGIPVFSNARGGIAVLQGPSGGFIIGYAICALLSGLLLGAPAPMAAQKGKRRWLKVAAVTLLAYAVVYVPGIPWFMHVMAANGKPQTFTVALKAALIPFIPGDTLKWIVTIPLVCALRPIAARYLHPADRDQEKAAAAQLRQGQQ